MPEIMIELQCSECGKSMEGEYKQGYIIVEPCEKCQEDEYKRGYDDGERDAS